MTKASIALSNLRAVVIVIVVAFHSALAYLASTPAPATPFNQLPYDWKAFPIVDTQRWPGFDVFCIWQDLSLMAMMFLLSGIFAAGSLRRKGGRAYAYDRVWRIGLPFMVACVVLSPPAYYAAYLTRTADPSIADFWAKWLSLQEWPAGPQWFLWQLLAINLLAAALYAVAPNYIERLGRLAAWAGARPLKFFALLAAASALAYVPLAVVYSPWNWGAFGPFSYQFCRPAHYLVYFFAGMALGSHGLDRGLLACDGPLARHWRAWFAAALASAVVWLGLMYVTQPEWSKAMTAVRIAGALAYPVASACGGLFFLGLCLRFAADIRLRLIDSLSANAYSIYMIHYVFVVWLQYALLNSSLIAVAKVAIVAPVALIVSWALSAAWARSMAASQTVAAKRAVTPLPR